VTRVVEFLRARTIYALVMLLASFVLSVELVSPGTVTPLWASNTLLFAAPLAIMAAGQTMVMRTGGIDLSVAVWRPGRPTCSRRTHPPAISSQ
jgi:ribose/xylose/arabinose/galactoside ABC-type transport system permease subunit